MTDEDAPLSNKDDALVVLLKADDEPLSASDIRSRMVSSPKDMTMNMKRLLDDGYVDRVGEGVRGDPYRYELTGKGEAAANDLQVGDGDPPEDAGLGQLFDSEAPDGPEPSIDPEDVAPVEAVRDLNDRMHRLRSEVEAIRNGLTSGDNVVELTDGELTDAVYLIANSGGVDGASYRRRTALIARLIGADGDDDANAHPDEDDDAEPDVPSIVRQGGGE